MLQLIKKDLETFFRNVYRQWLSQYLNHLDIQIRNIDCAMTYIQRKKSQMRMMIDRRTIELENKYIDLMNDYHISSAKNIESGDINSIKNDLNEIETTYAQLEHYFLKLSQDKGNMKKECDFVQSLMYAY
ncbi:hypothetical protein [Staphylococcus lutrae]|uniref:Staphylococcal protein n=1 Tax=Staphylococcus lutrae TaxID=155085 RepID=A0AAC9RMS2_9STAP|nr:hypothetical protein [Staphylococcus lutrae]ARJ50153.1 hypothetical protein B5P37_01865 [Staphylococcus lutrae]PNZ39386.1 hypothetical protein CD134_01735 [Staphylococcus lutrae]